MEEDRDFSDSDNTIQATPSLLTLLPSSGRSSVAAAAMRECISIHIGQAGVQMGNACWELYCLEHGQ